MKIMTLILALSLTLLPGGIYQDGIGSCSPFMITKLAGFWGFHYFKNYKVSMPNNKADLVECTGHCG